MRRRNLVILVVAVALIVAGMYGWNEYHRGNKDLSDVKAAFTVPSAQLITEFEGNDSLAEKKYLGKTIAVSGAIKSVEKDEEGNFTIVLGSSGSSSAVRCSMDTLYKSTVATLKENEMVTVKGTFTGYQKDETGLLGSDIKLNRSVIEKSNNK